ncbi:MAG: hypothetical protein M9892_12080 [Bacteroidetes bacterium]|nr:hypothetical protein [Bacteroidota bacterium]
MQFFPEVMDQTIENFEQNHLQLDEVLADAGYSSGEALQYLEEKQYQCLHPQTLVSTKQNEKDLFTTKNRTNMNVIKTGGNKAILTFKGIKTDSKGYQKESISQQRKVVVGMSFGKLVVAR